MKNVLLASTALVAFTGAAVADVALSGRAEMGIFESDTFDTATATRTTNELQFFTDIDVTFTMSGETDGGLTFGASVDLDEGGSGAAAVANNADDGGATIFISGGFGTVTMGDTDGALDWALTEAGNVGNPGSLADDETSHAGYNGSYLDNNAATGGDGQILRWDYSMGAFGVAISAEQNNNGTAALPANTGDIGFAVGLKYTADLGGTAVKFGLGYQDNGNNSDVVGISVDASLGNGLSAGVVYSDWDLAGTPDEHFGIGIGYTTGALSLHANYGEFDSGNDGFGIAAAYDLGGGAVVHFGYGDGTDGGESEDSMSFGLGLSF